MNSNLVRRVGKRFSESLFVFRKVVSILYNRVPQQTVIYLLLNVVIGLLTLPIIYIEKVIIDYLVNNIGNPDLAIVLSTLLLLFGISKLIQYVSDMSGAYLNHLNRNLSRYLGTEIETLIAKKYSTLDLSTVEDAKFSDKYTKIRDEANSRPWGIISSLGSVPGSFVGLISALFILVAYSPAVVLGAIIVSLPQVFVDSKYIKKTYELSDTQAPEWKRYYWFRMYLTRSRSILEIRLLNIVNYMHSQMQSIVFSLLRDKAKMERKKFRAVSVSELPLVIFEVLMSIVLGLQVIATQITIGSFQMYLRALRNVQSQLSRLIFALMQMYENYIYVKDLAWFLDLESTIENKKTSIKINNNEPFTVEFRDVWFRYRKKQEWILKGINFKVDLKENIALVGLNGAGKSTLIKLLCRLHDPTRGAILVGGVDLRNVDLDDWRAALAVLFQEFETYPFSAREAIGFGDISRLDKLSEIKEAAKLTGMDKYFEKLPRKYNNPLNPEFEKGIRPSIGQQQRIGISRMLFRKNAQVIIMDEPTASVDPQAEEDIFKELVKHASDKILIFVTQRFSTVRLADRILVMEAGKIAEAGTHKELMEKNGKYAHLFTLQAKGYQ